MLMSREIKIADPRAVVTMEYDKLAVNGRKYTWSDAAHAVMDLQDNSVIVRITIVGNILSSRDPRLCTPRGAPNPGTPPSHRPKVCPGHSPDHSPEHGADNREIRPDRETEMG